MRWRNGWVRERRNKPASVCRPYPKNSSRSAHPRLWPCSRSTPGWCDTGPGWGKEKTQKPRVEWHEMKMGVFYRHEQRACAEDGRGTLEDKVVVSWQGEASELGRRLHWQAQACGLGRAQNILALAEIGRASCRERV